MRRALALLLTVSLGAGSGLGAWVVMNRPAGPGFVAMSRTVLAKFPPGLIPAASPDPGGGPTATGTLPVGESDCRQGRAAELFNLHPVSAAPGHGNVAWGAYLSGYPSNPDSIRDFEALTGHPLAVVMWFKHWAGPFSEFRARDFQAVIDHGSVPMVSWMSDDPTAAGYPSSDHQPRNLDRQIAAGNYDSLVSSWARGLAGLHSRVLLRPDMEMNGNWYAWSPGVNGNTAADYVAMWQHLHDVFAREGAGNVEWVWSPNVEFRGASPMRDLYPGDAYVDWVSLDGYNFAERVPEHEWSWLPQIFDSSFKHLREVSSRPFMISEMGSVEGGPGRPEKSVWISRAFECELAMRYPSLRAVIWFDQDNGNGLDFRVNSSPEALVAMRAALNAGVYAGPLRAAR